MLVLFFSFIDAGCTCVVDTSTSPVSFKPGISIRLDLDADRLLQLKSSCARLKIEAKTVDAQDATDANNALALEAVP